MTEFVLTRVDVPTLPTVDHSGLEAEVGGQWEWWLAPNVEHGRSVIADHLTTSHELAERLVVPRCHSFATLLLQG